MTIEDKNKLVIFQSQKIRRTWYKNEWWFAINNVIFALTGSNDSAQYFKRMRMRDKELQTLVEKGGIQFVPPLRLSLDTVRENQNRIYEII